MTRSLMFCHFAIFSSVENEIIIRDTICLRIGEGLYSDFVNSGAFPDHHVCLVRPKSFSNGLAHYIRLEVFGVRHHSIVGLA